MEDYGIDMSAKASDRVEAARSYFLGLTPSMCCNRAMIYTEMYKKYERFPVIIRRGKALKETLEKLPIFITPHDVILGHPSSVPRSAEVFPEVNMIFMTEIDEMETRDYNRLHLNPGVKEKLMEIWPYWKGKSLHDYFDAYRTEELKTASRIGLTANAHEWTAFGHARMNYKKLLDMGIVAMRDDIQERFDSLPNTDPKAGDKREFYTACLDICDGILIFAKRYSDLAVEMAQRTADPDRKAELVKISEILKRVPAYPATTFHEALQSIWMIQVITQIQGNGFSITLGRMDQYLYPYYENDIRAGRLTVDQAQELIDFFFLKCCEIMRVDNIGMATISAGYPAGQNVEVGGKKVDGTDATNDLSYLFLRANRHIRLNQPNLTARFHKGSPKMFYDKVVESVAAANGMPQILNDETIIKAMLEKGHTVEEARDYVPVGCVEIAVDNHWNRANGTGLNGPKILEITMNNGVDPVSGERFGLDLNADECKSFDEFLDLYRQQLEYCCRVQVAEVNLTDYIHKQNLPLPLISMFIGGCIENGKDITAGGATYNSTGVGYIGTATVADSLYAIKDLVFEKKELTLPQFRKMLAENYENDEVKRQYIVNRLPKFGNDNDKVDWLAHYVTDVYFNEMDKHETYNGGRFWATVLSVTVQIGFGLYCGATPDGRKKALPLSDGLTPMYGLDKKGPTASMKSVRKVDLERLANGMLVNQRLNGNLFTSEEGREKVAQLFKSFVDMGGFHWQFNIVDDETLKDAQVHPEEHEDLIVRVAGYSAIFTQLSPLAQDSIIARYQADL